MNLLEHFRPEEAPLLKEMMQYTEKAGNEYRPVLTPFLDPRAQYILSVVAKSDTDLSVHFFGGHDAERKRAIIAPDYYVPTEEDFEVQLIEVDYPDKFVTLSHRNLLGTLMSAGIKRDQLGDIRVGKNVQFVTTQTMSRYLVEEIKKIKGAQVRLNPIPIHDMISSDERYTPNQSVVASLRLDNIVALMTKKSRSIAQKMIESEHVKVNHTVISKQNFNVEAHDLLSIKGYGRARITEIGDRTKKDKIRITYETLFK